MAACGLSIPVPRVTRHQSVEAIDAASVWTTQDEIDTLRRMYVKKDRRGLKRWLYWVYVRRWTGPGMRVEVGRCILEARDLLAELESKGALDS